MQQFYFADVIKLNISKSGFNSWMNDDKRAHFIYLPNRVCGR